MMYRDYFNKVEKILSLYPQLWSKNYYENKKDLLIIERKNNSDNNFIEGIYDNDLNIIEIYNINSLYHELFHMAFRDKLKVGVKINKYSNMYFSNGVSRKLIINSKEYLIGVGLVEGFCEYMANKCFDSKKKDSLNYYFVNLLIKIYGEEILEGLFLNDINKFHSYNFNNIDEIEIKLDDLLYITKEISIYINDENQVDYDYLEGLKSTYKILIISLLELIVNEFNNCKNRLINEKDFSLELEKLFLEPRLFYFDDSNLSVKEWINKKIDYLKKGKDKRRGKYLRK